jgi:UDP-N-acetyl-D-glucosamine dehydrogenase
MKQALIQKIKERTAVIGIIGLGYVGLPLIIRFLEEGFPVTGFDIDPEKIEKLKKGRAYLKHLPVDVPFTAYNKKRFEPTTDFGRAKVADVLIICVPTPLGEHREPDLSYVHATVDALLPHLKKGQLLSLESTTYPGTTDEEIAPKLKQAGFSIGTDFFVVYSPEREDPGNKAFGTRTIPKLVGGMSEACTAAGTALYAAVVERAVPVSSAKVAETAKLLENIYRAVNIGLVNEMKIVADKMGINIWEVIEAAATKPFGFTPFYPGPGLGGHCIPIDPFYLTWKAREYGVHTRFIELAGEINTGMPEWVVGKTIAALNSRKKAINGARILLLGVAYKKNIDDMRESPALELIELLVSSGAQVSYADPYVPEIPKVRKHDLQMKSEECSPETVRNADCVLIATDHDDFDYEMIGREAQLIVDTRGRFRHDGEKVERG